MADHEAFSQRELAVIRGIVADQTYAEIASFIGLDVETVRTYAARLRRRLQLSKAGIAAWAVRNKVV